MEVKVIDLPPADLVAGTDVLLLEQNSGTKNTTVTKLISDLGLVTNTTLAANSAAQRIGTKSGNNVQVELDKIKLNATQTQEELNNNLLNDREQWSRSLAEAGLTLVAGSFEEGATVNSKVDVVWHIAGGQCYMWGSTFPKDVPAKSTPASSGGVAIGAWSSVDDATLRQELAAPDGADMIGVPTTETSLGELLSSDDMAIKYGYVNPTISERLGREGAKVVLVGDSLSSFFNIDSVNTASIFESYLRRKIREFNGTAKFYNRAIGGKRYYDLGRNEPPLDALTSGYPWYTDTSKRWMTYLDDLKPDVIFLAFGMNDGAGWAAGNFQQANFFKMMEELKSISSSPELVFCTNILPSTTHVDTAAEDQQQGRDAMAGWTRSFARKSGYSFLDLHRRFKCLRDGVDPCMASYARKTIHKVVSLPYVHTAQCDMYSARVILIDPAVVTTGITFKLSTYSNNLMTLKYDTTTSRWITTTYTASFSSVGIADQSSMPGPAPAEGTEIYFTMNGDVVVITIGINTYPVFSRNIVRFGGKFFPEIGGTGDIRIDMIEGTPIPVKSELTDYDCYNTDGDGGNGINHPTAKASSRIYTRVVDDWFSMFAGSVSSRKQVLDIDFVNGTVVVRNPYSPELSCEDKISAALTFINGSLAYQRDAQGRVIGAVFGATNRAYVDQAFFNAYAGNYSQLTFEVEFVAPSAQAYICTFGENTTSDRIIAQVTSDLRPRITAAVASQASDLFGSASFPFVAGRKYALKFSLDCENSVAQMWGQNNSARGNINVTPITAISPATLSKLKLGYASTGTFGVDVVVSRIRVWFSN